MSKKTHLLTYSLLALSVTGCQTTRNVTNNIVNWRPFGGSESSEVIASEDQTIVSAEGDSAVSNPEVATLNDAEPLELGQGSDSVVAQPAKGTAAELASQTKPVVAESPSFEDFMKSVRESETAVGDEIAAPPLDQPSSNDVVAAAAQPETTMPDDINTAVALGESTTAETAELSNQIEALLSEYQPAQTQTDAFSEPEASVEVVQESAEVAQLDGNQAPTTAELTPSQDPSMVAYDLASFADASVSRKIAPANLVVSASREEIARENVESSQPATPTQPEPLSFEQWAATMNAAPETTIENNEPADTNAAAAPEAEVLDHVAQQYPWAAPGQAPSPASDPFATPDMAAVSDSVTVDSKPVAELESDAVQPSPAKSVGQAKLANSNDVLRMLEEALGRKDWNKAQAGQAGLAEAMSPETRQIVTMMKDLDAEVRLSGVRQAYATANNSQPVVDQLVKLLDDEALIIRTRSAATLHHWDLHHAQAAQALSTVVNSDDQSAAQLAAMFLGEMKDQTQIVQPLLTTSMLSTSGLTSMYVAEALLKHDATNIDAVVCLSELMRHENVEVRWLTAHALGSVQGDLKPYAVEALRSGLRDIDSQVRATSALSLGGLGSASRVAVAELQLISKHAEPKVKDAAAIALDCIK